MPGQSSLPFSAVPVQRPRQQVEAQLKRAILDGSLAEGSRLPSEHTLSQTFGVSRATIREALRSLTEGGLLAKPGTTSGLYVQSVDHRALARVVSDRLSNILDLGSVTPEEVHAFRDLLEVPSARMAALHRSDTNLASLRGIIDEERATTFDDPAVTELNARFHCEVADASGNRVLSSFVSALHRTAHPLAFVHTDEELGRTAVAHHIALFKTIEQQDPTAAMRVMHDHLEYLHEHASATGATGAAPVAVTLPR
ncbi:FadR/GntR family transcriptional regulator [Microbacterium sp.]|uniref:FadR/GntR family transcriptional regulator n=1 Tax=Microbacterium sp. TaxID=51671 RepID=UPI0039E2FE0C